MIKGMPDLGCFFSSHQPTHNTSTGKSVQSHWIHRMQSIHKVDGAIQKVQQLAIHQKKRNQNHQDKASWFLTQFFTCLEIHFSSCIHLNPLSFFPSDLANFLQNLKGDEITVPSEGRNVLHESMSCIFSQVGNQRELNRIGKSNCCWLS